MINEIDVAETEARIVQFRKDNASVVEANIQRDESYAMALREQEDLDRQRREERARELAHEEEEERLTKDAERKALIDQLESSDKDARKLVEKTRAEIAKKNQARNAVNVAAAKSAAKVLRTRAVMSTVPDEPHVPIQDSWYAYEDKYTLRSSGYEDVASEAVRLDREGIMRAGGYIVEEAWERAIRSAVAGLDIRPLDFDTLSSSQIDSSGDVLMPVG